jgi:hypothetical protein
MSTSKAGWLILGIVIFNAACTALNVALYASEGNSISLGAAVFCAAMTVVSLMQLARVYKS